VNYGKFCLLNNMDIEIFKMNKKKSILKFGLIKGCLITSFNNTTFIKNPLFFIIKFYFILKKIIVIRYY
jgi:hypothetical protein